VNHIACFAVETLYDIVSRLLLLESGMRRGQLLVVERTLPLPLSVTVRLSVEENLKLMMGYRRLSSPDFPLPSVRDPQAREGRKEGRND